METRNYIHYVVVSFAKSNWTVIVYIFFNITLHKQMEQFDINPGSYYAILDRT